MASLRLTFPEKDEPTVIALTGARLTIGRLPFNTIQIIDRTVSGFHAELISEHGHYRLHDRGSSNGTFVNGQKVADFHLSEACTITFGTVEAQFSPEAVAVSDDAESFPTRNEINAVRKENAELKATVEALREETNSLRLSSPMENADGTGLSVPKVEFDKLVVEREALKEAQLKQDEEVARLKTDLAVLKRDRVNLQLAYDGLQREITDLRATSGGGQENAISPKAAAAALASQSPTLDEEIRVEVPEAAATAAPEVQEASAPVEEPVEESAPEPEPAPAPVPVAPPRPMSAPALPRSPVAVPMPKAPALPVAPSKPFAPLPKAPAVAVTAVARPMGTPTVVARPVGTPQATPTVTGTPKAPMGLGSGIRPIARVPMAPSNPTDGGSGVRSLPNAPTTRLAPRATTPPANAQAQPTVKMVPMPRPVPKIGPKGSQKLTP
jgi:pSer/pThr/pTyr-binding forkhead associated (FHA) protein